MVGRSSGSPRSRWIAASCVAAFTALALVIDSPSVFASTGAGAATTHHSNRSSRSHHRASAEGHPTAAHTTAAHTTAANTTAANTTAKTTTVSSADLATIVAEANWIVSAQIPDGAIGVWPDTPTVRLVWPYLANMAATGLARATEVTGDQSYAQHAWAYLQWYSSVEQPGTGYVTDYKVDNGTTPVSTGTFDSTDAYAGTFLSAAWDTYAATGNQQELASIAGGIAGALHAIATTQQPDGLTWATPTWQVAYLMDNAQAYGGLVAAGRLEAALGNSALAAQATQRAATMEAGIQSLWDPATGAYDWAKQANGWQHPTEWSNFYPDAMEEVVAVQWGAVTGGRAQRLMDTFEQDHSDWSSPTAQDDYLSGATVETQPVGYWPMAGVAFDAVGHTQKASSGVNQILTAAAQVGYGWPYTTGDAGDAIMALSGGPALDPVTTSGGGGPAGGGGGPGTGPVGRPGPPPAFGRRGPHGGTPSTPVVATRTRRHRR